AHAAGRRLGVGAKLGEGGRPPFALMKADGVDEPIRLGDLAAGNEQVLAAAESDRVLPGVAGDDVGGGAAHDGAPSSAQAAALADGEAVLAVVAADRSAFGVEQLALDAQLGALALGEGGVIVAGDEADLVGIGLVEDGEAEPLGLG